MTARRAVVCALLIVSAAVVAKAACAGDLEFTVRGPGGAPAPNAVVTVYPAQGSHATSPATLVMEQKDIAFAPFVLVAPVGSTITFPNHDTVRHHVYSFSAPHRFELKLYGREEQRSERFDKAGVVALGCNIHDRMAGFIDVVDTRFAGRTDANGRVLIAGLPSGAAEVRIWHPWSKAPGAVISKTVALNGETTRDEATLDLRNPPPGKQNH